MEVPTKLSREQKKKLEEMNKSFETKQFEKGKKYADSMGALYGVNDPYQKKK